MDDNSRRRRPNEPPIGNTSNTRYSGLDPDAQRRSYGGGATDRYRPAPLNTTSPAARSMGSATGGYSGYYQESGTSFPAAMPQNAMQYGQEYGQDARQPQSFAGYNPSIMYNVPQAAAQSTVYDTTQQFPSRQPAGMSIMPTDVAPPYFTGEPSAAAAGSALPAQAASSSASTVYQPGAADQRNMLQNYPGSMGPMSGMSQTSPDQIMEDQDYSDSAEMGEAYQQYQSALKEIFQNIRNGTLASASSSLLNVSDWLLTKVNELGLAADNQALHAERLKLWQDFNHAWLSLGQKQKYMVESGVPLQRGQSLVTEESLKKMGKELVRLCDGIERHGLVDYEYGVWEEPIIAIIEECLDLYENVEDTGDGDPGPSHTASR